MNTDSRQALVELLLLAIYVDNHLSLLEDAALDKALSALGWEPGQRNDVCVTTAFARAREAAACELKTEEFLQTHVSLLKDGGHAVTAFGWLSKVLGSDGMSASENRFLYRARKLMFE
jgi:hypothetical protein